MSHCMSGTQEFENLNITFGKQTMVVPARSTERLILPLSNLDHFVPEMICAVHVYHADYIGKGLVQVLHSSLAEVLVENYPVAGRIVENKDNSKLEIDCNAEGVLFIEAYADHDIKELGEWTSVVGKPYWTNIIPEPESGPIGAPILCVQVTQFRTGGFVLGIAGRHFIMDGTGWGQFMDSWAKVCRGIDSPRKVTYDRSFLLPRSPPIVQFPHLECASLPDISNLYELVTKNDFIYERFPFTRSEVKELIKTGMRDGTLLYKCTGFEALAAHLWRTRTKALGLKPAQMVKLLFSTNGRSQVLGNNSNFVGNVVLYPAVLSRVDHLLEKPLSYAVRLIQKAKKSVTKEYIESAIDHFEITRAPPTYDITTFTIATWTWLGFTEGTDFGWGAPVYVGPHKPLPGSKEFGSILLTTHSQVDDQVHHVLLGLPSPAMQTVKQFIYCLSGKYYSNGYLFRSAL